MLNVRRFHIFCCLAYSLISIGFSIWAGPLISWDFEHYHLYVPYAWAENRLPQELFAASGQGYLNPLPHLPFYFVYKLSDNGALVGATMALLHSANLWLLHGIACQLIRPDDGLKRLAVFSGVLLGMLSPGFMLELGSSYTDIVSAIPLLGALLLLLVWVNRQGAEDGNWAAIYSAGLLAGIATGMKPSSIVCAVALLCALLLANPFRYYFSVSWRAIFAGCFGGIVAGGAHAWMLWKSFGNPVFPLFNGIFDSRWFPSVNAVSNRFRPLTWSDAISFPFGMADSSKRVSLEAIAVDIRPVWIIVSVAFVLLIYCGRRLVGRRGASVSRGEKLFWYSIVFFVPMWIYSSGNIRYAIQNLALLGPAIAILGLRIGGRRHYISLFAILLPLTGQAALATNLNERNIFDSKPVVWNAPWIDVKIPKALSDRPAYYFSLQPQGYASFALFFPKESRFLNLIGQTTLAPDSLVVRSVESYAKKNKLPLRTLYKPHVNWADPDAARSVIKDQNSLLSEYGYQVDGNDCHMITTGKSIPKAVSCAIKEAPAIDFSDKEDRERADSRFSYWEGKCPGIFNPTGFWSANADKSRWRIYLSYDFTLVERGDGKLIALSGFRESQDIYYLEDENGDEIFSGCPPARR